MACHVCTSRPPGRWCNLYLLQRTHITRARSHACPSTEGEWAPIYFSGIQSGCCVVGLRVEEQQAPHVAPPKRDGELHLIGLHPVPIHHEFSVKEDATTSFKGPVRETQIHPSVTSRPGCVTSSFCKLLRHSRRAGCHPFGPPVGSRPITNCEGYRLKVTPLLHTG